MWHRKFLFFFFCIQSFVLAEETRSFPYYQWAVPVRVAVATCSQFHWVSHLPLTSETVFLLKRSAVDTFGLSMEKTDFWENGTAEEFLEWMEAVGKKGDLNSTLIFYFSTHQRRNGRTKFSKGQDLEGERLVQEMNEIAKRYQRILFINDSCYASALEKKGVFSERILRFYSSKEDQLAIDLNFDKGPYGLEEFIQNERSFLKSEWQWNPKGTSFLAMIGFKSALALGKSFPKTMDLQMVFKQMEKSRDLYDQEVRQAKVQNFILIPSDANFEMLKRMDDPQRNFK